MALTTTEQQQVTLGLSRYFSSRGIPISSIDEVALYQAVGTTSGVIDGVQATFYAALPAAVWDNMAAGERLENAHTYDFRGAAYAAPATAGNLALAEGTLTDGAQIDNWANGELAIVRIRRVPGDTSDRMLGHVDVIPFGIYAVEA